MQYLKVKLARWVLGTRRMKWNTTRGFKNLGWMTFQQTVAYRSIRIDIKVMQNDYPKDLYKKLTVAVHVKKQSLPLGMVHKERELRVISTDELQNVCSKKENLGSKSITGLS